MEFPAIQVLEFQATPVYSVLPVILDSQVRVLELQVTQVSQVTPVLSVLPVIQALLVLQVTLVLAVIPVPLATVELLELLIRGRVRITQVLPT